MNHAAAINPKIPPNKDQRKLPEITAAVEIPQIKPIT